LADFQPKVPENSKNDVVMLGNSVLGPMETKPKLVVLDTMNFLDDFVYDVIKRR
jgi:hypothetical protein